MPLLRTKDATERDRAKEKEKLKEKEKDREREREREKRRDKERDRDRDRDPAKERDRDRDRPRRSSRSHRKSLPSPEPEKPSSPSTQSSRRRRKDSATADPASSTLLSLASASKTSLPYPTFSKAHSKEAIGRDGKKVEVITPDPTDVGRNEKLHRMSVEESMTDGGRAEEGDRTKGGPPPSPPLTATTTQLPRHDFSTEAFETIIEETGSKLSLDQRPPAAPKQRRKSTSEKPPPLQLGGKTQRLPSRGSRNSAVSVVEEAPRNDSRDDLSRGASPSQMKATSAITGESSSTIESDRTSVARDHPRRRGYPPAPEVTTPRDTSPASAKSSSAQTPVHSASPAFPFGSGDRLAPSSRPDTGFSIGSSYSPLAEESPRPPPPPPAPTMPLSMPRVDYLLLNGGLPRSVSRALLSAGTSSPTAQYSPNTGNTRSPTSIAALTERIFAPYLATLDAYESVLEKKGSMAVATGYKSVARRLLDRLENVFARNISAETCECVMCQEKASTGEENESRLGWGDVLEWVSGRREVPAWPAFDFTSIATPGKKAGDTSGLDLPRKRTSGEAVPIDADIPEEFRDHYVRQSKKTRDAVDKWLTSQPVDPRSPPPLVDDETLTFAILTHLEKHERPIFNALMSSPTDTTKVDEDGELPLKQRPVILTRSSVALQRLYRLSGPPRDPEIAIFLLKNPSIHNLLATLAAINASEYEVLTSGRFDGFLWSGADDVSAAPSQHVSRGPTPASRGPSAMSRNMTPFSNASGPARTSTPFHQLATAASKGTTPSPGNPVPHDEEMEIAVLAEVEREIYNGMEALEDAFEVLHRKAEAVRQALRERGAGLSMAGQTRRQYAVGGLAGPGAGVEIIAGTPQSGASTTAAAAAQGQHEWESESEAGGWGNVDDGASELWPDDSASNISSSRVRRPKRRNERRTPALVEESEGE